MSQNTTKNGPVREECLKVWGGDLNLRVRIAGSGPAIVYFHPAAGLYWDGFLDALAENYTVYAPEMPGTTPGDPYAIYKVETYNELLLIYEEVLGKLGLERPVAIGQSMGGMVAADLAATYPGMFKKLIGMAPTGLWREDAPPALAELYASPPEKIPGYIFHDPSLPAAQAMFALPEDPQQIPAHIAQSVWTLGCASKFLWPFPDHGLGRRLHRIAVPTLILWGRDDRLIPAVYAEEFKSKIAGCEVKTYDNCGHVLQIERLDQTLKDVNAFIRA